MQGHNPVPTGRGSSGLQDAPAGSNWLIGTASGVESVDAAHEQHDQGDDTARPGNSTPAAQMRKDYKAASGARNGTADAGARDRQQPTTHLVATASVKPGSSDSPPSPAPLERAPSSDRAGSFTNTAAQRNSNRSAEPPMHCAVTTLPAKERAARHFTLQTDGDAGRIILLVSAVALRLSCGVPNAAAVVDVHPVCNTTMVCWSKPSHCNGSEQHASLWSSTAYRRALL